MKKGDNANQANADAPDEVMEGETIEIEDDESGKDRIGSDSMNDTEIDDISINMDATLDYDIDLDWDSFDKTLKQQVNDELSASKEKVGNTQKKNGILRRAVLIAGTVFAAMLLFGIFLIGTKPGRKIIYRIAGNMIHDSVDVAGNMDATEGNSSIVWGDQTGNEIKDIADTDDYEKNTSVEVKVPEKPVIIPRHEEYVSNFLIFGIEEIEGAKNTDAMMIASINTKDDTIKLTSLLRDTVVETPGYSSRKLNAVYAKGGASLLVKTIELNYRIKIDGYASINFEAFESAINLLGGVSIELGEEEAKYLNKTNYISNPTYRDVVPGWNLLNGNQALGYCRVRKVPTLGGSNDDYGRTLRQRRVIKAVFNQYKAQNLFDLLTITKKCLGFVTTNVTQVQIETMLEDIVENKITSMDTFRIPVNGMFDDPDEYHGVSAPLVLAWEDNIKELYKFVFLDAEEENVVTNTMN